MAAASSGKRDVLRDMYEVGPPLLTSPPNSPTPTPPLPHPSLSHLIQLRDSQSCRAFPFLSSNACFPSICTHGSQARGGSLPAALQHNPTRASPPPSPLPSLQHWPFFQSLMDLIEMVMAKGDMRIASLYDQILVEDGAVRGAAGWQKAVLTPAAQLQPRGSGQLGPIPSRPHAPARPPPILPTGAGAGRGAAAAVRRHRGVRADGDRPLPPLRQQPHPAVRRAASACPPLHLLSAAQRAHGRAQGRPIWPGSRALPSVRWSCVWIQTATEG